MGGYLENINDGLGFSVLILPFIWYLQLLGVKPRFQREALSLSLSELITEREPEPVRRRWVPRAHRHH